MISLSFMWYLCRFNSYF